jgi:hypothetical protein
VKAAEASEASTSVQPEAEPSRTPATFSARLQRTNRNSFLRVPIEFAEGNLKENAWGSLGSSNFKPASE